MWPFRRATSSQGEPRVPDPVDRTIAMRAMKRENEGVRTILTTAVAQGQELRDLASRLQEGLSAHAANLRQTEESQIRRDLVAEFIGFEGRPPTASVLSQMDACVAWIMKAARPVPQPAPADTVDPPADP